MHKQLLIAFLLFGLCSSATAQIIITPTKQDTIQAVRTVFHKHRIGGLIWTGVGGALAFRIVSVAANSNTGGFTGTTAGTIVGGSLIGGIPASVGVSKLNRFSKVKEEQTVQLYEKSALLPPYVKKRLKRKYFAR